MATSLCDFIRTQTSFMKRVFMLFGLLLFIQITFSQNVGIGTTTPHASAALDIQSTNKGMLVPRIALTSVNLASPVSSPADALLVYNTATAGSGDYSVTPGFYYWNSTTSQWIAINGAKVNNGNTGFGSWGDCTMTNISEYNPVAAVDGTADDNMGRCVSISGSFAIAGANGDDIGANADQGSAYIFYFNGTNWIQQQKLVASDGAAGNRFGYSVGIFGNYAIVGAYFDDIGANSDQGSAYIFFYNGSTWIQQQKLTASDGLSIDAFGYSVFLSGNYATVAAVGDDVGANTDQGSAYIFFYNGSTWVQQQKLVASDGGAGDSFGTSVSLSGNYAVIGAAYDDINANSDQGSAYIFFYNGSTWGQQQKLTALDGAGVDFFGIAVSISGTYAIIGSYADDNGPKINAGSAYIFYYNGSAWSEQQKLIKPDGAANDFAGISVSLSGNYAIVGAYQDTIGTLPNQGSACIYQNTNGIWSFVQKVARPGGNGDEAFGISCSIDITRFIIGAFGVANNRGMAFFGKIN